MQLSVNMKINQFDVLFENDNFIIVNKPSGLLTIPDRYNQNLPNLKNLLLKTSPEIFVVHRLDRDTSGAVIFAKNAESHKYLNEKFENHTIERIYHVVVKGVFPLNEVDIDIPLMTAQNGQPGMIPSARGKYSLTKVKVLEKFRFTSLLECSLVTGRQHQIRVHLSALGHPLLVDELYGGGRQFYLSDIKKGYTIDDDSIEKPIIERLTMHARSISFTDERTKENITATADYPKEFSILIKQLKKYSGRFS